MKIAYFFTIFSLTILIISSCNKKQDTEEILENFISVVNTATKDSTISQSEAEEISILVNKINSLDSKNNSVQKILDEEKNKELSENLTTAMMSLFFCEGYELIEGLD